MPAPHVHPAQMEPLEGGGGPGLRVWAPAKLNLDLRVFERRSDGMHPLDSIVAKISLCDRIDLRSRGDGEVRLVCTGSDCGPFERNLAYRAAMLLRSCGQVKAGVEIGLAKSIPPGKGLGGGSSDAAAVLAGLDRLWRLGLPQAELMQIGSQLGSDVPLFLGTRASRMTGRGEILQPVRVHPFAAVLYMGDLFCATPEVYKAFDALPPPAAGRADESLLASAPPSAWRGLLRNDLLPAAEAVCPALGGVRRRLERQAGLPVSLTGSGSAMFILCDNAADAEAVLGRLEVDLRSCCTLVRDNPW